MREGDAGPRSYPADIERSKTCVERSRCSKKFRTYAKTLPHRGTSLDARQRVIFDTFFTRRLIAFSHLGRGGYGYSSGGLGNRLFPRISVVHHCVGSSLEVRPMSVMYVVGGILSIILLVYLMIALLKPEKF